jgi:alkanesulfonate monooxygenase SsuD/methylene tetrahydromethanopterin reductase-like flavin-dependent oxidoreductase (luciferase family)
MAPRIAVELPAELTTPGEFLADVRAYEVAGAEAIWLGPASLEPLTLLAAAAAVTYRVHVGAWVPAGWPDAPLTAVVRTVERLSPDRLALAVEAEALAGTLRGAGCGRVLMAGSSAAAVESAVRLADGIVCQLAEAAGVRERIRTLRPDDEQDQYELWARAPAPGGRAGWGELLADCETAGATGLIIGHAPNLLDILRNPEEDDRRDLAMAVG